MASGAAFFSSTKLDGRTCLRVAIGATNTEERHVTKFWDDVKRVLAGEVLAGEGQLARLQEDDVRDGCWALEGVSLPLGGG